MSLDTNSGAYFMFNIYKICSLSFREVENSDTDRPLPAQGTQHKHKQDQQKGTKRKPEGKLHSGLASASQLNNATEYVTFDKEIVFYKLVEKVDSSQTRAVIEDIL